MDELASAENCDASKKIQIISNIVIAAPTNKDNDNKEEQLVDTNAKECIL